MNELPSEGSPRRHDGPGLPPRLEAFGGQLEQAIARDLRRTSIRRRLVTGGAIAATAAIAVFAGIALFGGTSGGGPAHLATASALDKAAAALRVPAGTILHVRTISTEDNGDGTTVNSQAESWQSTSPPYESRQIEQAPGTPRMEIGAIDGKAAVYDAATKTIYVSAGAVGTSPGAADEVFRQQALAALRSDTAKVVGHAAIDGRDAIKIVVSPDVTYLVDARTYDPVEWIRRSPSGGTVLRFMTYEQLQPTVANLELLSLTAQHPDAKIDTSAKDFEDAVGPYWP